MSIFYLSFMHLLTKKAQMHQENTRKEKKMESFFKTCHLNSLQLMCSRAQETQEKDVRGRRDWYLFRGGNEIPAALFLFPLWSEMFYGWGCLAQCCLLWMENLITSCFSSVSFFPYCSVLQWINRKVICFSVHWNLLCVSHSKSLSPISA